MIQKIIFRLINQTIFPPAFFKKKSSSLYQFTLSSNIHSVHSLYFSLSRSRIIHKHITVFLLSSNPTRSSFLKLPDTPLLRRHHVPVQPVWLFKKKLNRRDVATLGFEKYMVMEIEEYREEMKTALDKLLEEEERDVCTAEDPMGDTYDLNFSYYEDGNFAVFHRWVDVVFLNDLREGDTVECWGNFVGDDEIHATLHFRRENQDSKTKVPLKLPLIPTAESKPDGRKKPPPKKPDLLLFEKKLDSDDFHRYLNELVLTRCNKKLRTALEEFPCGIRVSTVDPNKNVEDRYVLCRAWRQVVADNGLKEGDSVIGYGNDVGGGEFRVQLYVLEDKPSTSDVKKDDGGRKKDEERKEDAGRMTLLLLGKDGVGVIGRTVINGSSKDVAEVVVVAREGIKMEEYDEGGGFARFSAKGANGAKYEWREAVGENGFTKSEDGLVVSTRAAIDGAGNI